MQIDSLSPPILGFPPSIIITSYICNCVLRACIALYAGLLGMCLDCMSGPREGTLYTCQYLHKLGVMGVQMDSWWQPHGWSHCVYIWPATHILTPPSPQHIYNKCSCPRQCDSSDSSHANTLHPNTRLKRRQYKKRTLRWTRSIK
jgi:hypothetical protein